jgi:DNA-binding response OmpR family regulator
MNVNTANSAKEAPAKMKEWNFDAFIVDLDLQDISGIEF